MIDSLVRVSDMPTLKLPIVGDRILIQNPSPEEISELYEIESDPKTKSHLGGGHLNSQRDEWIAKMTGHCCPSGLREKSFRPNCPLAIALKESRAVIGRAKLQYAALARENCTDLQGEWQLEVVISAKFWGSKLGEETAKCLSSAAFANYEMPALYAVVHPENTASMTMAQKLGFVKDGVQASSEVEPRHLIYKLTRQGHSNA